MYYNSALKCLISFDRYPRINLLKLMISLSSHYKKGMYFKRDNYRNYHSRNCNDSNQEMVEENRWMRRFLHLVDECLPISQTLYMTGKKDVFKFVDELEKGESSVTCYARRHIDVTREAIRVIDSLYEVCPHIPIVCMIHKDYTYA